MKKTIVGAFAALLGAALVVASAAPAAAAPGPVDTSTSIELTITDRADSGAGTPGVWAKDTFTRKVEVTTEATYGQVELLTKPAPEVLCDVVKQDKLFWTYVVVVKDSGTFKTANNSATGSPGAGESLIKDATGTFNGGATAVVVAPAHWCTWKGDSYHNGVISGELTGSTSHFIDKLFGQDANIELTKWGWTYERCAGTAGAEKWINAKDGNSGDIRGAACPSPSASPSVSASPVASASPAPAVSTSPVSATLPLTGSAPGNIALVAVSMLALGGLALGGLAVWNRRRIDDMASAQ